METIVAKHIEKVNKFHKKYGKAIILILNDDLYYAYNEDAEVISKSVGIALLTSMEKDYQFVVFGDTMLDVYLPRLVRDGHRVVIIENIK